jgi:DNA-binding CsgD family transcriptional regulator
MPGRADRPPARAADPSPDAQASRGKPRPRGMATGATIALLVVDDERRCLETNLAACRLLGLSKQRLVGRRLDDLFTGAMADRLENVWRAFSQGGGHAGPFDLAIPEAQVARLDLSVTSGVLPGRHLVLITPAPDADTRDGRWLLGGLRRPSPRELEILELLAGGARDEQIAEQLSLSPATVQTHVRNAKAKLGARTRAQAVAVALRQGMISLA